MIHRIIGLRQDGSFVELKRCTTREGAVLFRKLYVETGEFTNVLIFWVPKCSMGSWWDSIPAGVVPRRETCELYFEIERDRCRSTAVRRMSDAADRLTAVNNSL